MDRKPDNSKMIEYHKREMEYYKRFDKDLYRYHRDELRKLDNSPLLYTT